MAVQVSLKNDEYADDGDTLHLATRDWEYYWNPLRGAVRRYGASLATWGRYEEVRRSTQPYVWNGSSLSSLFSETRRTAPHRFYREESTSLRAA